MEDAWPIKIPGKGEVVLQRCAGTVCLNCQHPVLAIHGAWYVPGPFYGLLHQHCVRSFNYDPYAPGQLPFVAYNS